MFKKKSGASYKINIPSQVISVWGPGGNNTADFCLNLARELSANTYVLLVELPCLGIPHLSFAANVLDRNNHVEAALTEFWYKGEISLDYLHQVDENLALLPINAFANPTNPLSIRVELDVLINFPVQLINSARKKGYNIVIFNCQGQLTHPMTFFALKNSEKIILPVDQPSTIAYSLLNIKKLMNNFKVSPEKFVVVSSKNIESISEVMYIKNENQDVISINSCSDNVDKIIKNHFLQDPGDSLKISNTKKPKKQINKYFSKEQSENIKEVLDDAMVLVNQSKG